ncbi:pantothenate kinase [Lawsonia intracellularis]|uniref:type III pantothenate kinase n=1 Tax=Lawsonia intracellularis TaxID=29546 RepID=UPI0009779159|nr:type III pantothenate kinase [Lawsonia intracellularis]OMQ06153.1 pantothenate kinase [Lawsonia intracellularis]
MENYGLFIDVGNTSVKIGIGVIDRLLISYTLSTNNSLSGDTLGIQLLQCINHAEQVINKDITISSCMMSSVVPTMDTLLQYACERFLLCKPHIINQDFIIPLDNHYEEQCEVGADRLVAAYAARRLFPDSKSVVSVDYGTATTFDCVTDSTYLGGLICPGIKSSLQALYTNTAKLPSIILNTASKVPIIGKNTKTSLTHGFLFGFATMTEGIYSKLINVLDGPVTFVATGGFARDMANVVCCFDAVCPDLILDGLHLLWIDCLSKSYSL